MNRAFAFSSILATSVALTACGSDGAGGASSGGDGGSGSGSTGSASSGSGSTGSGAQGDAVDCSWFASPDSCWAKTVSAATACAPPGVITDDPNIPNNVGVFAADRKSCTYDDGTQVTFAEAVPDPESSQMLPFADYVWDFAVKSAAGDTCVSLSERDEPFTVHLPEGDFTMGLVGSPSDFQVQISCPDGSKVHIPLSTIQGCWDGFDNGPTSGFFNAGDFVTYELYGGGFEEKQLFLCK